MALDLEATGMDPRRDEIIEIALVIFTVNAIVDRFQTLVRPNQSMSADIVALTGIEDVELRKAPLLSEVRDIVRAKIGARPVVAHSVALDVQMLEAAGMRLANRQYDTFVLASLLLPNLTSYSLPATGAALGLTQNERHRAASDADSTALVFQRLMQRIDRYDSATLEQVGRLAKQAGWAEAELFTAASERRPSGPLFAGDASNGEQGRLPHELAFLQLRERPEPLKRTGASRPVDEELVERLLSSDGPLAEVLPKYEHRPEQIAMARRVARALNEDGQLLVEAGTGTGKSMAYLLPSALLAAERGERIVVSTDTLALQDQLYRKDLPDLLGALARAPDSPHVDVAVLKGRANYLCLRRWFQEHRQPVADATAAAVRAKVLLWLGETETGDRSELKLSGEEDQRWRNLGADEDKCVAARCIYNQRNQCFLYRARREAEHAHLIIANHALLLSDATAGSRILPDFDRVVIDEAHHLEEQATVHFGFTLDQRQVDELVSSLVRAEGLLQEGALATGAAFLARFQDQKARELSAKAVAQLRVAQDEATRLGALVGELFARLSELVREEARGSGGYAQSVRVTDIVRRRGEWVELELLWERVDAALSILLESTRWFLDVLDDLSLPDDPEDLDTTQRDELVVALIGALRLGHGIANQLIGMFGSPDAETVYWVERSPHLGTLSLHAAPLFVDELLREHLFNRMRAAILTSATITTDGAFEFVADRVGLPDSDQLALPSPFDYERSTLLYLADDVPEPQSPRYQAALQSTLLELCAEVGGSALVLFTSHSSLQATYRAIKQPLDECNVIVLGQRIDGNPRQLVERLRTTPNVVVLGTASFWEGVDIVGQALSLLVITKLPFSVPSDPVFAARSELMEQPFLDYAVPQAILRFKQGFGRLIRSSDDRGVCVVLDRRVVLRRYGASFVQSLPSCHVQVGRASEAAFAASRWLSDPTSAANAQNQEGGWW
ncbi:MAG: DEAD/DEAH box helicase family protein [Chloroflexia bacterium]|nr:DEAD/DEAH box helicase family protein [Chloroflexia bacterium]